MLIQNVKGGYDFLPKEQINRNYITNTLKEVFEKYGYMPIETPILCYFDILAGKYEKDNDILKEIYKLKDQGNRLLGLRYDLTIPFAKFIALNKDIIKFPFKRYEIAKVFRDGPVKVGRDREFTQCDVDVVGLSGQMIEAELLSLYQEAFKHLAIDIVIKYNNRKLMRGLILECGLKKEDVFNVITIIDKKDKLSNEEFKKALMDFGLNKEQIANLEQYFLMDLKKLNATFKDTSNEEIKSGLVEINNLKEYIDVLGLNTTCQFVSSLARGQDYYTGNVFEVYEKNGEFCSSIGGGGRYDNLVTDFISDNQKYPAVGISFGLTSIYEILKARKTWPESPFITFYIIPLNTFQESLKLAQDLRNLGYKVDLEMSLKKLKNSLDYANKNKIPYVIILGEDELVEGKIKVKDMYHKNEIVINLNNLAEIKKYIN